jgi:hypothetical protein
VFYHGGNTNAIVVPRAQVGVTSPSGDLARFSGCWVFLVIVVKVTIACRICFAKTFTNWSDAKNYHYYGHKSQALASKSFDSHRSNTPPHHPWQVFLFTTRQAMYVGALA